MARQMLAHPGDEMVGVWHVGDDWAWALIGKGSVPPDAEIVVQDRVQNSDVQPTMDEAAIRSYAADIVLWLQAEVESK